MQSDAASISSEFTQEGHLTLTLKGRLSAETLGELWGRAVAEADRASRIVVEAGGIDYCDGAGAALLSELSRRAGGHLEIRGLADEFQPLLKLFAVQELATPVKEPRSRSLVEGAGRATADVWNAILALISFVGEALAALLWAIRHPKRVPWNDTFLIAEVVGVNAFFIISLIGFLLGLILAFQSAIPMQQFGAEIFVADLVAISMLKELGPLMTAIVLAGRSGSAFAAEIGTMKVNEELDALTTMGLDPVRFLVVTRVIAAVLMTPLLAAFCSFFALIGAAVVLMSLGFPLVTYGDRVVAAVKLSTFLAGMVKAFAYAILVAGVGCLRGMQTGTGAKAVGDSTTSAVVSGIILIALAAGVFSVVLYALRI